MKKIFFVLICIFTVCLIYFSKSDNKISFFEVSDYTITSKKVMNYLDSKNKLDNYVQYNNKDNYRVINLINDINNNKKIKHDSLEYSINNLFIKSDYIILNIGHQDIDYYLQTTDNLFVHLDNLLNEYEVVLKSIRDISKENIIIVFNYNLSEKYKDYLFNRMSVMARRYNSLLLTEDELYKHIKRLY